MDIFKYYCRQFFFKDNIHRIQDIFLYVNPLKKNIYLNSLNKWKMVKLDPHREAAATCAVLGSGYNKSLIYGYV